MKKKTFSFHLEFGKKIVTNKTGTNNRRKRKIIKDFLNRKNKNGTTSIFEKKIG